MNGCKILTIIKLHVCMYGCHTFFLIEGGPESLVNKLGNEDVPTLRLHVMFENV